MSTQNITDTVDFSFIRYASCWEDADLLVEALKNINGRNVLSIASAGDNSFSLLVNNPSKVVAVDVNEVQLYLCELKKEAIRLLNHQEFLEFAGFNSCNRRSMYFDKIKPLLSQAAQSYWQNHITQINEGVVYQGKFEKYLKTFAKRILPLVHSKKKRIELTREKTLNEQVEFYKKEWNTWRYRLLFKIFFSKAVMGKFGRDPEFLAEVKLKVSDYIFNKTELHLCSKYVQNNHFVYYLLNGNFSNHLPHYARKENYELIRARIDNIEFRKGYLQDFASPEFTAYNMSNIFEYMDKETFESVAEELVSKSVSGSMFAYWNLMVPRRISLAYPAKCIYKQSESLRYSEMDKCFFYNQFVLEEKV